jgi:hypothetical protein
MIAGVESKDDALDRFRLRSGSGPLFTPSDLAALSSGRTGRLVGDDQSLTDVETLAEDSRRSRFQRPAQGTERPSKAPEYKPGATSAEEATLDGVPPGKTDDVHQLRRISTTVRRLRPRLLPSEKATTTKVTAMTTTARPAKFVASLSTSSTSP